MRVLAAMWNSPYVAFKYTDILHLSDSWNCCCLWCLLARRHWVWHTTSWALTARRGTRRWRTSTRRRRSRWSVLAWEAAVPGKSLHSLFIYCYLNVQYDGNWVILYSLLANMAWPSNISCDRSISLLFRFYIVCDICNALVMFSNCKRWTLWSYELMNLWTYHDKALYKPTFTFAFLLVTSYYPTLIINKGKNINLLNSPDQRTSRCRFQRRHS